MKKFYAVCNALVVVCLIIWNYVANSAGINDNSIASVSDKYSNASTPADYAFSIWGLIYLALLAHCAYQIKKVFFDKRHDDFVLQMGPWLIIANVANAAWLLAWLNEWIGLSVVIMLLIFLALFIIIFKLNMERWDAPAAVIAWVWWPICFYSGWIAVAAIANIAAFFVQAEIMTLENETAFTMGMILLAALINALMLIFRNMREFAVVGVWALIAIAVRQWGEFPVLQWTALACAIFLSAGIALHAYQNRKSNPFFKPFF